MKANRIVAGLTGSAILLCGLVSVAAFEPPDSQTPRAGGHQRMAPPAPLTGAIQSIDREDGGRRGRGDLLQAGRPAERPSAPGTAADKWEPAIRKFEAADKSAPPPTGAMLLVGGSNARRWESLADDFPGEKVINRGFGGARLSDVLHYADRIVLPYAPKVVILNAGGNDLASGATPEQVRDACRDFVAKVHAALPDTRIVCVGLPPTVRVASSPEAKAVVRKTNRLLAELAGGDVKTQFIDLFPHFLDEAGSPRAGLYVQDGTHFTPAGYKIVAGLIKQKLQPPAATSPAASRPPR